MTAEMVGHSTTYASARIVKLKVKVISPNGTDHVEQRGRITISRDAITYDKLRKHMLKTFNLQWPFLMTYPLKSPVKPEITATIFDDWDLDAALQQCQHSLKITVHYGHNNSCTGVGSFDIVGSTELIPPENVCTRKEVSSSILNKLLNKFKKIFSNKTSAQEAVSEEQTKTELMKSQMTLKEFHTFLDSDGRMVNWQAFRESVFRGGISPKLRRVAWRHLLNVYPMGMTSKERQEYLHKKSVEYMNLKAKWKSFCKLPEHEIPENIRLITTMVKKDVIRTDRQHPYYKGKEDNKHIVSLFDILVTYSLNHPDVSYCQGMCDYASPLLVVQDNEANAYLLFCSLMERVKHNFSYDGKAISCKLEHLIKLLEYFDKDFYIYMQEHQVDDLLFTYRWILLEMRREFPYEDSLFFMETMWSTIPIQPIKTEITLYQEPEINLCSNTVHLLSPYAKLTSLTDQDALSDYSQDESVSAFSEPLSLDQSVYERQLCIEEAMNHQSEVFNSYYSGVQPSEISCSCRNNQFTGLEHEVSTFYIELDKTDYISFVDDDQACSELQENQCSCYSSAVTVDSGYLSRPNSPSRQPESQMEECTEVTGIFPPPQEFGFGNPFLLFAALTIILHKRDVIMSQKMDFNEILMLFNSSMKKNDVNKVLQETKMLYDAYMQNDLLPENDDFVHIAL